MSGLLISYALTVEETGNAVMVLVWIAAAAVYLYIVSNVYQMMEDLGRLPASFFALLWPLFLGLLGLWHLGKWVREAMGDE